MPVFTKATPDNAATGRDTFYDLVKSLTAEYDRLWCETNTLRSEVTRPGSFQSRDGSARGSGSNSNLALVDVPRRLQQQDNTAPSVPVPASNGRSEIDTGFNATKSTKSIASKASVNDSPKRGESDNEGMNFGDLLDLTADLPRTISPPKDVEGQDTPSMQLGEYGDDDDDRFPPIQATCSMIDLSSAIHEEAVWRAHFMRDHWMEHIQLMNEPLIDQAASECSMYGEHRLDAIPNAGRLRYKMLAHGFVTKSADAEGSYPCCMIDPSANIRVVWGIISITLLFYDLITVPVDVCFELEATAFSIAMTLTTRVFWSCDIPFTFLSGIQSEGRLIMQPLPVALKYIKTWFCFDITLIVAEWVSMYLSGTGAGSSSVSMLRIFRWSRLARLVRVFRLIKLQKVKGLLREAISISSQTLNALVRVMKNTCILIVGVHCMACLWHLVGDHGEDGWVKRNALENTTASYRYAVSLHWIFVHLQAGNGVQLSTTIEYVVDALVCFASLLFCSHFFGCMLNMILISSNSNVAKISQFSKRYIKRNHLSHRMAYRLEQCLSVHQLAGHGETLAEEEILFAALPQRMQMDLNYQVRAGLIQGVTFFVDMLLRTPRMLRNLTHCMRMMVAVEGETMFAVGDVCSQMFFITEGEFEYTCAEATLQATPRHPDRPRKPGKTSTKATMSDERHHSNNGTDLLSTEDVVSEAVLWTTWEHQGDLMCIGEALTLNMDADAFAREIISHKRATVHAVKYARHFCWQMNRAKTCDITAFDLSLETLDVELYVGGLEDHFGFISHYKVEAGTEATLMRDEMEIILRKDTSNPAADFKSPIFIDSEDLVDLTRLVEHVKGSLVLILLLTPGLLSRPWCLLEMVAARRWGRPYVPVLLNRPGMMYEFPDEEFYARLHRDEIVAGGREGRKLLEENGTTLAEVEQAIRSVSKMIALSFSPHKSAAVRGAEMEDILKRCMRLCSDELQKINSGPLKNKTIKATL